MPPFRTLLIGGESLPLLPGPGPLQALLHSGDLVHAPSAEAARLQLGSGTFELLLMDLDALGTEAWSLLEAACEQQPKALRAALAPDGELSQVLSSVGLLHQVCPRPESPEALQGLIGRLHDPIRRRIRPELRDLMGRLQHLPSVPKVFRELRDLLQGEGAHPKRVARVIQQDMGLCARILGLVNSAFFGLPRPVPNIEEAVTFLGTDTLRALVLAQGIFDQTGKLGTRHISLDQVWTHSLSVSRGARALAAMEGLDPIQKEEAFMGGLLHDVGILILAGNLPERFDQVLELSQQESLPIYEAEVREFGASHAEVGAHLLGLWGLPRSVLRATALHHAPGLLQPNAFDPVLAIHVADHLCGTHQHAAFERSRLDLRTLDRLGLRSHLEGWNHILRDPVWK